jgi:hypothetical protein
MRYALIRKICVRVGQRLLREEMSGGELLEIRLLNNHLLDTFGSKSTARHFWQQINCSTQNLSTA